MTGLKPAQELAAKRRPPFAGESPEYALARQALLVQEIELRRNLERVAGQRRALPPGPEITRDYRFIDQNGAEVGLKDLFGAHDALIVYFWMFGPQRKRPCPMCTNMLGGLNGNAQDIKQKAALKIVGRSPIERQIAFAQERGWANLDMLQTVGDDYPNDLGLLTPDGLEWPSMAVFAQGDPPRLFWADEIGGEMADPGQDPRGAPDLAPLWNVLDMTPSGRDPHWYPKLRY